MKGVLVDTSIWVDHFRQGNGALVHLLELDLVLIHPLIRGELACGTPPKRQQTLKDLSLLQPTQQATIDETVQLIEQEKLYGEGCGLIDLQLLASTLITPGVSLWTWDKRLDKLAQKFGVAHFPQWH
jgi:predicted nucleic acid-binding protein